MKIIKLNAFKDSTLASGEVSVRTAQRSPQTNELVQIVRDALRSSFNSMNSSSVQGHQLNYFVEEGGVWVDSAIEEHAGTAENVERDSAVATIGGLTAMATTDPGWYHRFIITLGSHFYSRFTIYMDTLTNIPDTIVFGHHTGFTNLNDFSIEETETITDGTGANITFRLRYYDAWKVIITSDQGSAPLHHSPFFKTREEASSWMQMQIGASSVLGIREAMTPAGLSIVGDPFGGLMYLNIPSFHDLRAQFLTDHQLTINGHVFTLYDGWNDPLWNSIGSTNRQNQQNNVLLYVADLTTNSIPTLVTEVPAFNSIEQGIEWIRLNFTRLWFFKTPAQINVEYLRDRQITMCGQGETCSVYRVNFGRVNFGDDDNLWHITRQRGDEIVNVGDPYPTVAEAENALISGRVIHQDFYERLQEPNQPQSKQQKRTDEEILEDALNSMSDKPIETDEDYEDPDVFASTKRSIKIADTDFNSIRSQLDNGSSVILGTNEYWVSNDIPAKDDPDTWLWIRNSWYVKYRSAKEEPRRMLPGGPVLAFKSGVIEWIIENYDLLIKAEFNREPSEIPEIKREIENNGRFILPDFSSNPLNENKSAVWVERVRNRDGLWGIYTAWEISIDPENSQIVKDAPMFNTKEKAEQWLASGAIYALYMVRYSEWNDNQSGSDRMDQWCFFNYADNSERGILGFVFREGGMVFYSGVPVSLVDDLEGGVNLDIAYEARFNGKFPVVFGIEQSIGITIDPQMSLGLALEREEANLIPHGLRVWVPINSKPIESAAYDSNTLRILFDKGIVYEYIGVPEEVFETIINSKNPISYFNQEIRGKYNYRKINREDLVREERQIGEEETLTNTIKNIESNPLADEAFFDDDETFASSNGVFKKAQINLNQKEIVHQTQSSLSPKQEKEIKSILKYAYENNSTLSDTFRLFFMDDVDLYDAYDFKINLDVKNDIYVVFERDIGRREQYTVFEINAAREITNLVADLVGVNVKILPLKLDVWTKSVSATHASESWKETAEYVFGIPFRFYAKNPYINEDKITEPVDQSDTELIEPYEEEDYDTFASSRTWVRAAQASMDIWIEYDRYSKKWMVMLGKSTSERGIRIASFKTRGEANQHVDQRLKNCPLTIIDSIATDIIDARRNRPLNKDRTLPEILEYAWVETDKDGISRVMASPFGVNDDTAKVLSVQNDRSLAEATLNDMVSHGYYKRVLSEDELNKIVEKIDLPTDIMDDLGDDDTDVFAGNKTWIRTSQLSDRVPLIIEYEPRTDRWGIWQILENGEILRGYTFKTEEEARETLAEMTTTFPGRYRLAGNEYKGMEQLLDKIQKIYTTWQSYNGDDRNAATSVHMAMVPHIGPHLSPPVRIDMNRLLDQFKRIAARLKGMAAINAAVGTYLGLMGTKPHPEPHKPSQSEIDELSLIEEEDTDVFASSTKLPTTS